MSDQKLSQLGAISSISVNDLFYVVDDSDSSSKSCKASDIKSYAVGTDIPTGDGSASSPSITFSADTNTGLFRQSTDTVSITAGGSEKVRIANTYSMMFQGITVNNNANWMGYDVATYSSSSAFHSGRNSFMRAGGTSSSPSATATDTFIGSVGFRGHNGTAFASDDNARLLAQTTESHATNKGTALILSSTSTGSSSMTNSITCSGGAVGINMGSGMPTAVLDINGNRMRIRTAKTPTSSTDTGEVGSICWDSNYIYVCTATNTWKRTALSSW